MKQAIKILAVLVAVMLLGVGEVRADTEWTSGHHVVSGSDSYFEICMYSNATADIFGGEIYKLETFNITAVDIFGGQMDLLYVHDDSTINIYNGNLDALGVTENGSVDLYAYDVTYHPDGGHFDRGWIEGKYIADDLFFTFDLNHLDTFSHINVVPEPSTILLFALGTLFLRKQN